MERLTVDFIMNKLENNLDAFAPPVETIEEHQKNFDAMLEEAVEFIVARWCKMGAFYNPMDRSTNFESFAIFGVDQQTLRLNHSGLEINPRTGVNSFSKPFFFNSKKEMETFFEKVINVLPEGTKMETLPWWHVYQISFYLKVNNK